MPGQFVGSLACNAINVSLGELPLGGFTVIVLPADALLKLGELLAEDFRFTLGRAPLCGQPFDAPELLADRLLGIG